MGGRGASERLVTRHPSRGSERHRNPDGLRHARHIPENRGNAHERKLERFTRLLPQRLAYPLQGSTGEKATDPNALLCRFLSAITLLNARLHGSLRLAESGL